MMNCEIFQTQLDDYLDGELTPQAEHSAQQHLTRCSSCRHSVEQAKLIQKALHTLQPPMMSKSFAQRAIKNAVKHHHHRRQGFVWGFSSALAASIALLFVAAIFMQQQRNTTDPVTTFAATSPNQVLQQVTISVGSPQTVNLLFDLAQSMEGATLSIVLPANVELAGFPGQREISWQANLRQGPNILPLPLKGITRSSSDLIASIEYAGKRKAIRIHVNVHNQPTPQATLLPIPVV
ncbi:MAG: hypothetical protein GXP10_08355 [Gammaproteobacteria bacterium]|nr:hypothetical protein [Gammaproteobacteria bacterium]